MYYRINKDVPTDEWSEVFGFLRPLIFYVSPQSLFTDIKVAKSTRNNQSLKLT